MAVSNGQDANQTTFNSAFISRTQDSDTIGKVGLNNTSDVNSGAQIVNTQRLINEVRDATGVAGEGDTNSKVYSSTNYVANGDDRKVAIGKLDTARATVAQDATDALTEATDLRTLSGTSTGETDLGTFTGSTIAPSGTIKQALQDLEDAVELKLDAAEKGAASGVCPLDGASKVPASYLPSVLQSLLGNWNASTNSPTLADGVGDVGDTYRVSVAGTQNLGSGSLTFEVGDWIYYASGVWYKLDATDAVTSVNGQQGAVSLTTDNISEGSSNLYYTNARFDTRFGTKSIDALSDVDTTTTPPATDDVLKWDGTKWKPGTGGSGGGVNFIAQRFSGNGSTTNFTLSSAPGTEENTQVFISGVYQQKDTYSVSGTTLTFSTAPPTGTDNIEVMIGATATIGVPADSSVTDAKTNFTPPTRQIFTSGSGTYTKPASAKWLRVRIVGGGGGGAGGGNSGGNNGGAGGNTTFGSSFLTANGGAAGTATGGGASAGGTATGGDFNISGGDGAGAAGGGTNLFGGYGGQSAFGGGGPGGSAGNPGSAAATNSGSGGGGGSGPVVGGGGGAGGYLEKVITSPSSTYAYAVGAAGTAGTANAGGQAGGAGGSGLIIVEEYYQ